MFEMICGQCRGNLLVEQFGVVVACPHCGAHLSIPAPAAATPPPHFAPAPAPTPVPQPVAATTAVSPPPQLPQVPSEIAATTSVLEEQLPFFGEPTSLAVPELPAAPSEVSSPAPNSPTAPIAAAVPIEPPTGVLAPEPVAFEATNPLLESLFSANADTLTAAAAPAEPESTSLPPTAPVAPEVTQTAVDAATPTVNLSASGIGFAALLGGASLPSPPETAAPTEAPTNAFAQVDRSPVEAATRETKEAIVTARPAPKAAAKDHVTVSKTALLLLVSYASAVTFGFAWLFFRAMKPQDQGLESLPDVNPPKKNVSILLIPEKTEMPPGHELEIGDSQRFGNIKVTVLKVTRGPIQFVHFSRNPDKKRLPTSPVLKLWLKFENVSEDQTIAPLDARLLFARSGKDRFTWRGNQFVCRLEDKANRDQRKVLPYDYVAGDWDLASLTLDKPLKPGESRDYYVPTGENDLDFLTGDLLWRVHFRKGYGPKGRGVTTVFEVHFASKDIQDEHA